MIYVLDLDGTLIDSSARHGALLKAILDDRKVFYPSNIGEEYLEYKRDGNTTFQYLKNKLHLDDCAAKAISREWVNHIEDWKWISLDILYPDSIPFLRNAVNNNTIFYLSCRRSKDSLLKEIEELHIAEYAQKVYVISPEEGYNGKKAIIKRIANEYSDRICVFGDTEIDEKAAKGENCEVYLLNRGFRSKKYWESQSILS